MTYFLNKLGNEVNIQFTTPFPDHLRSPKIDEFVRQRSIPAALLLDLSARHFVSEASAGESEVREWITACFDRAKLCREYIKDIDSITKMSDSRKREITFFYKDYMVPTFKNGRPDTSTDSAFSEAREFFSSKDIFKRRFKESVTMAETADAAMEELEPVIGSDELLSDLKLMDDPQILAIRRRQSTYTP